MIISVSRKCLLLVDRQCYSSEGTVQKLIILLEITSLQNIPERLDMENRYKHRRNFHTPHLNYITKFKIE